MIGADSGLPFNYCDILLNWFSGCFTLVMYQIQTYTKIEIVVCYDILHLMQVAFILHVFRLWGLCVTETRTLCPILITPPIWSLSCLSPTTCSRVHSGVIFAEIRISYAFKTKCNLTQILDARHICTVILSQGRFFNTREKLNNMCYMYNVLKE